MLRVPPPLALAVLGQAKADFLLSPEGEITCGPFASQGLGSASLVSAN
jgi:hypothetical protein